MKKEEVLKTLGRLKEYIHVHYAVKEIGLFGSVAKGSQKKGSDIDVLVEFEENADLFSLVGLSDFLTEKLKHEVDVVPKRALRRELRASVTKDVIYV